MNQILWSTMKHDRECDGGFLSSQISKVHRLAI